MVLLMHLYDQYEFRGETWHVNYVNALESECTYMYVQKVKDLPRNYVVGLRNREDKTN